MMSRGVTIIRIGINAPDVSAVVLEKAKVQVMHGVNDSEANGVPIRKTKQFRPTYPVLFEEVFPLNGVSISPESSSGLMLFEISRRPCLCREILNICQSEVAEAAEKLGRVRANTDDLPCRQNVAY